MYCRHLATTRCTFVLLVRSIQVVVTGGRLTYGTASPDTFFFLMRLYTTSSSSCNGQLRANRWWFPGVKCTGSVSPASLSVAIDSSLFVLCMPGLLAQHIGVLNLVVSA